MKEKASYKAFALSLSLSRYIYIYICMYHTKYSNYLCACLFYFTRLVKIKEWVDGHDPGALVIPFSGGLESSLQDMSEEEMQKYCTEHKTQRLISIQSPHTLLSAVSSVHPFNCMC